MPKKLQVLFTAFPKLLIYKRSIGIEEKIIRKGKDIYGNQKKIQYYISGFRRNYI